MMEMTRKTTKELEASILAGEMKNAWQVEDRPNRPDARPAQMRQGEWNCRSRSYRSNYDRIFRKPNPDGSVKNEGSI